MRVYWAFAYDVASHVIVWVAIGAALLAMGYALGCYMDLHDQAMKMKASPKSACASSVCRR